MPSLAGRRIWLVGIGETNGAARGQRAIEPGVLSTREAERGRVEIAPEAPAGDHAQRFALPQQHRRGIEGDQPFELAQDGVEHGVAVMT